MKFVDNTRAGVEELFNLSGRMVSRLLDWTGRWITGGLVTVWKLFEIITSSFVVSAKAVRDWGRK